MRSGPPTLLAEIRALVRAGRRRRLIGGEEAFDDGRVRRGLADDDVPMTLDWEALDTREKLLAFVEEINRRRETADGL